MSIYEWILLIAVVAFLAGGFWSASKEPFGR